MQLGVCGCSMLPILSGQNGNPDQIRPMGFPYGTLRVDEKLKSVQRVFQGYVVSRIIEFKPVGVSGTLMRSMSCPLLRPEGCPERHC